MLHYEGQEINTIKYVSGYLWLLIVIVVRCEFTFKLQPGSRNQRLPFISFPLQPQKQIPLEQIY